MESNDIKIISKCLNIIRNVGTVLNFRQQDNKEHMCSAPIGLGKQFSINNFTLFASAIM